MAKTCNVCKRTYPDNLKTCPHCAKTRAEDSSVIRLHDPDGRSDWEGDPSSSSHERRGDVITVDPQVEMPAGSPEDSSIEIQPEKGGAPDQPVKKKTQLAPKGRETKLHGKPADEADLGQQPSKSSGRSAPETMIAKSDKPTSPPGGGSSVEIVLDEGKSGSSEELTRKKQEDSSLEISLEEKQSGSSVELEREGKAGSSVERRAPSSVEINLDEKESDGSPSSSLLLGGPGSDSGSGKPSSSDLAIAADQAETGESSESGTSAVDLGSSLEVRLDEERGEAAESDSEVAVATAREPEISPAAEPSRPRKKGGAGMGLLIGGGVGLLAASLVWIFGPLDGLRGSLRDTVGLSSEKKAQSPTPALKQIAIQQAAAKEPDDEEKPAGKAEQAVKPGPADDSKETTKPAPAPAPVTQPVEKKEEVSPAPAITQGKPAPDKNMQIIAPLAEAYKLSKERKFKEAITSLREAKKAGFPDDDSFRRYCEELEASWQFQEKLGSAGYLAQKKDPLQALDTLMKENKDASTIIAAALEKIKAGKDVNLTQAIESLLENSKKADEKVKTMQAGKDKLEKEKEEAQSALTTAATLLKQGKYVDEQSPSLAQGVEKLLADKKNSDTQVKEANAKLKDAEETIQDITKKLVSGGGPTPPTPTGPTVTTSAKISPPDITVAEKYYSAGLSHFWSNDYSEAEKDFATAIRFYNDDARFFYYLGLSLWQEGRKSEAIEAFQKGNTLELQSRPSSSTINATFERIQGDARKALDREREQPKTE